MLTRTKGATNIKSNGKPETDADNGEPKVTKKRGRLPGQKIEREPAVIIPLNKNFRVKITAGFGPCLQEKGEPKEDEIEKEKVDTEDMGWKNPKYFNTWEQLFKYLVFELTRQKAKKEEVLPFEKYYELFEKSTKEAKKMFAPLDEVRLKG